jgi:gas vesicle protein
MSDTKYFLYGLGIGAVAGVLLAPRSGHETMRMIGQTAAKKRNAAAEQLDRARRAAETTAEGIATAFEKGRDQLVG